MSLVAAEDILAICEPMRRHFAMKSLVYKRVYADGREINLTTHPEWVAYYFDQELHQQNVLEKEIEHYVKGHLLWSQIPTHSPILQAAKQQSGLANGLTLVRPDHAHGFCEFYFMGAEPDNAEFTQVCTNNIDLLDQFTDYFRYQASELIERLAKHPIVVADKFKVNRMAATDIPCYQNQSMRHQFQVDLNRQGVLVNVDGRMIKLSKREAEVARLMCHGMTMKQMGERLFISPRTVETHIDHIKIKLAVKKKADLIGLLKTVKSLQY